MERVWHTCCHWQCRHNVTRFCGSLPKIQSHTKTSPTKAPNPRRCLLGHLISGAIHQSAKEHFTHLFPLFILDTTSVGRLGKHRTLLGGYRCMLPHPHSASGADVDLISQLSAPLSDLNSHAPRGCPRHPSCQRSCCVVPAMCLTCDLAKGPHEHRFLLCNEIEEVWTVAEDQATKVENFRRGQRNHKKWPLSVCATTLSATRRHKQQGFTGRVPAPIWL